MEKNHIPNKVWVEITNTLQNFNGSTIEVWNGQFHPTFHNECNYVSMLGSKLSHVSRKGHQA